MSDAITYNNAIFIGQVVQAQRHWDLNDIIVAAVRITCYFTGAGFCSSE
jgi:hypothetical protein